MFHWKIVVKRLNKVVITKLIPPGGTKEAVFSGVVEEDKLTEVYLENPVDQSRLNNIYIGKVQNIVKNINAAFVEFQKDCVGYFPLEELEMAIFTKKQGKKSLVVGDEILVQVVKEAYKTKAAVLTSNLSFPGKYFVITTGKNNIGLSGKLSASDKKRLKELTENVLGDCPYGVVVRTNAASAEEQQLREELQSMTEQVRDLLEKAMYRTVYTKLTEDNYDYLSLIKNAYPHQMEQIVTDDRDIYQKIKSYLEQFQPQDQEKLVFYEDDLLPLKKLYNLELQLEHALRERVWLRSGAYLVIEQTEAFGVIDVNTGKFDGRKQKADTFLKINLEAAKEAARQIRLRNLSGIILIDFINMKNEEDNKELMEQLAHFVKADRVKTHVVDMTALGIVEVTRKKERCCLSESVCHFA